MTATRGALERILAPVVALDRAAWAALAVGGMTVLLGAAAWSARLHWLDAPWWVLLAWGISASALAVTLMAARRAARGLATPAVARRLESGGAWRQGALTSLLVPPAPGGSDALYATADRSGADAVRVRGPGALEPIAAPVRRRAMAGALSALAGFAVIGTAGPVRGTAAALWHPHRAWEATRAPVRLRASARAVDRGSTVSLAMDALGRRQATLWLRAPGEGWRPQAVALDSTGHAERRIGPLESDLYARLTSGTRSSDTVLVHVRLPAFLGTLTVSAHYPPYLHLDDEPLPVGGDTIVVPAGTRLDTRGEATAELRAAAWAAGREAHALAVRGATFAGSLVPASSGAWTLTLTTASGAPIGGDTVRLPIRVLADSAPHVEIPVPGADTVAPLDLKVPLVIDVRDDHGLASVTLESRRVSRLGVGDSVLRETIPLPAGRPDRAIVAWSLLLDRRGLLPGDSLRYRAVAGDNAPAAHVGRSREFVIRIPTASEMRAAQREASDAIAGRLDSIAERSAQLERQSEDLAAEQPRPDNAAQPGSERTLQYDQARKAEAAGQAQEQLVREAEALKQSIEQLQESARQAGLNDPEWQKHLDEIRRQLDQALTPEMRERLAELQDALKQLDAERAQEALKGLAEAQRQLKEALERARELFKRAALEGELANLSEEARDLAQEQRQWNEQVARADSARAAAAEQELAARADSLAAALRDAAEQAGDSAHAKPLETAAERAKAAAGQMKSAAQSASAGQRSRAGQQGEQAAQSLEPMGAQIDQMKEAMQAEWRQEVADALDRSLAETARLTERELKVQQQFQQGGNVAGARGEQGAVEEGVQKLLDQLRQAAGKNALISPQIGAALSAAQQQMEQAREAVSSASPNAREAAERAGAAVDALNAASYELVRSRSDVSGAQSGSGMAEAIERMGQMARQQGQLGQQGAGMLPMLGAGGMESAMRQLGARQRALGEQLERMRAQGNMPGAGEMANEAKELARQMEAGRLDRRTVERQERLFRRMLDAGRTLQGREEDEKKERQSTTATGDSVSLPPALRARLDDESGRPRMPGWDELQRLSPEERRLVVDYFRRLSEPAAR
jgi:hypothetical protein